MAIPLLETKFHVPKRRRTLVARSRLSGRVTEADSALTLVSAPAGFGKTTMLTEWLAAAPGDGPAAAWLSLDQRDNDPALFWAYVVTALQRATPAAGTSALSLLSSGQSPMEAVLATLLNDLDALPQDVVLVLDDYHVIESQDVHDGMAYLLEHAPPQMRVVIASRSDPPLPLARLRARGELVEIRAADLRFTPEEADAYLNEVMGLELRPPDVAALEGRTEGWIAALQLAALSMQGRDDVAGFIASFAGDDRYVVDYLVGEVLQRQPDDVRSFLLQTSVLTRLNGSLCDAVTGQGGGAAMLEALDRANLFLVALDDRRHWYRYHHLFADMLRARLLDEQPELAPELHRRASDWYGQERERPEAIRHAMAGGDFERAADLVELAIPAMQHGRQEATLRRWLEALPEELFHARPVLSLGYVGALMSTGEMEGVEARLRDAERWSGTPIEGAGAAGPSTAMVVVDEARFRSLPASIAMYRAALARLGGDVPATMTFARRALELASADDHLDRGGAASLLGLAHWTNGDLDAAHRWYGDGMATLEKGGYHADLIAGAVTLADIRVAQGRLREAMTIYQRGLQRANEQVLRGAADMHVGMSVLFHERNDLEAATRHLLASRELGEHAGFSQSPYRWRVAMARVRAAEGDLVAAVDLLDEAERVYNGDFSPNVRPISAWKARVRLAQGDIGRGLAWARERNLSADDHLSYVREFEHITLARVLMARHQAEGHAQSLHEAAGLLERLLAAAEDGRRAGSVIEIFVVQALLQQARGDMCAALAALGQALTLGEPEGYARVFLDEGPPVASLLSIAAQQGVGGDYARHLLGSVGGTVASVPPQPGLVEPLSRRELAVLRLLRTDLSGPDIARELTVSLNTMRTHTKNIYTKLGVSNRRAAVRRAEELDL